MKFFNFLLLFLFSTVASSAQENIRLDKLFLEKFINDNKSDTRYFKEDILKVYSQIEKDNLSVDGVKIVFFDRIKVKEKVLREGEFNLVEMSDYIVEGKIISVEFSFLKALGKEEEADFAISDNTNAIYCLQYDCTKNDFNVSWCGQK